MISSGNLGHVRIRDLLTESIGLAELRINLEGFIRSGGVMMHFGRSPVPSLKRGYRVRSCQEVEVGVAGGLNFPGVIAVGGRDEADFPLEPGVAIARLVMVERLLPYACSSGLLQPKFTGNEHIMFMANCVNKIYRAGYRTKSMFVGVH